MNKILDLIIPRYVTDKVACVEGHEEFIPLCQVTQLTYEDLVIVTHVCNIKSFNLFGICLFPKHVGEIEPFDVSVHAPHLQ